LDATGPYMMQTNIIKKVKTVFLRIISHFKKIGMCGLSILLDSKSAHTDYFHKILTKHRQIILKEMTDCTLSSFTSTVVQTAAGLQGNSLFVRLRDRRGWHDLNTVIPEALTMSILGYPFIMSPGLSVSLPFSHQSSQLATLPEEDIYLRWLAAVLLFPNLHFHVPPWWLGKATSRKAAELLKILRVYLPTLQSLALQAGQTGKPILRPLWWIAPDDTFALLCKDQYMLGSDVIVAPVLQPNTFTRDIYLPAGEWVDEIHGTNATGPRWLRKYSVQIDQLARFKKQAEHRQHGLGDGYLR